MDYLDLTKRQTALLDFIKEEINAKGYPPTVREIGEAIGLQSPSTVHSHLVVLEEKGYIRRDPAKPRAIEVINGNSFNNMNKEMAPIPIVGTITGIGAISLFILLKLLCPYLPRKILKIIFLYPWIFCIPTKKYSCLQFREKA